MDFFIPSTAARASSGGSSDHLLVHWQYWQRSLRIGDAGWLLKSTAGWYSSLHAGLLHDVNLLLIMLRCSFNGTPEHR